MTTAKMTAFAKYLPDYAVTNNTLSRLVDTNDDWIYSRSGIRERRISLSENTSALCAKVFDALIKKRGVGPEDIDMIIVATTTPDYLTPTTACLVQSICGAKNAFCFDVGAGCSGLVYALSIAEKYIKSGACKNAAVIGAEVLSKLIDWSDRSTCVLFGDGAGGILLESGNDAGILNEDIRSDGSRVFSITGHSLPVVSAFTESSDIEATYVAMDGRAVFDFAVREIPMSIDRLLTKTGLSIEDIGYFVLHQANYRIIEAIAKKLKLDMSRFFTNMDKYGNTSAASIGIALAEMHEKGLIAFGSGIKLILSGFGSGLTWGSVLVEL